MKSAEGRGRRKDNDKLAVCEQRRQPFSIRLARTYLPGCKLNRSHTWPSTRRKHTIVYVGAKQEQSSGTREIRDLTSDYIDLSTTNETDPTPCRVLRVPRPPWNQKRQPREKKQEPLCELAFLSFSPPSSFPVVSVHLFMLIGFLLHLIYPLSAPSFAGPASIFDAAFKNPFPFWPPESNAFSLLLIFSLDAPCVSSLAFHLVLSQFLPSRK